MAACMNLQNQPKNEILFCGFNQDQGCFVCGTESGFRVYNTDPFALTFRRNFDAGLGPVAMLFRSNILALVGGGSKPIFQVHKVMIWDDKQPRCIAELSFRSQVRAVRLRLDMVVIVIDTKIYMYRFSDLSLIDHVETSPNPKGLIALSSSKERIVLACPGMHKGRVCLIFFETDPTDQRPPQRSHTTIIAAHEATLAVIAVNYDGTRLATASEKGTLVRVYDTATQSQLQELRRGVDRAEIYSITFSHSGIDQWMAVSSDKGTIHVFKLSDGPSANSAISDQTSADGGANPKSKLRFMKNVLPAYFSSEWSFAQYRVADYRCICAFGAQPHTLVIICADGSYYKVRFHPEKGGPMVKEQYYRFDDGGAVDTRTATPYADRADRVVEAPAGA
jgi:WD40 repeat protein